MTDNITKKERSRVMSLIPSKGTKPELFFKKQIRGLGFTFHPKLKGNPDFANKKTKIAVFLHGCFWHGCSKHCRIPETNRNYWKTKIKMNISRDKENKRKLNAQGYNIVTVWEHDLNLVKMEKIKASLL